MLGILKPCLILNSPPLEKVRILRCSQYCHLVEAELQKDQSKQRILLISENLQMGHVKNEPAETSAL